MVVQRRTKQDGGITVMITVGGLSKPEFPRFLPQEFHLGDVLHV